MVGNDVVDLADVDADAATYSPRWLKRVCTSSERHVVESAPEPHRMRWRIWAAKEAAYKRAAQIDSSSVFSPRAFRVTLAGGASPIGGGRRCGHVEWQGERIPLFLEEGSSYVHAWVDDSPSRREPLRRGLAVLPEALRTDPDGPGRWVRRCVVRDARARLGPGSCEGRVVRDGRIPQLSGAHGRLSETLSLSHHGRFVAFVWRPTAAARARDAIATSPDRDMNGALA